MVEGESGAPGFLWPATTIDGFSAANRSSAAIQFSRLSGVVSPTYMRHWLYTTSPATIRPIDGSTIDRRATTYPLDERIDQDQSNGSTLQPERPHENIRNRKSESHPGRALSVLELGALSDLDDIAVRVADVAADLAVLGNRRREELGSPAFPQFVARLNVRNAEIHKAVDVIRIRDAERYRRLIRGRAASNVQNHPDIRKLKVPWRVAITQAQNASAEDLFIVASRSLDVCDGKKMRDADPLSRGHLIALLPDLYTAH